MNGLVVNVKKRIIITITILLLLLFVVFGVGRFYSIKHVNAAGRYDFSASSTSDQMKKDNLKNYSSYGIVDAQGFVYWYETMHDNYSTFENKTTYILNDLSFYNALRVDDDSPHLYGDLDGQNHTISYMNIYSDSGGLFDKVYATIKNIHFYNPRFHSYANNKHRGILAWDIRENGAILNCIITDPVVYNDSVKESNTSIDCATISAYNDEGGVIKNCLVRGTYSVVGSGLYFNNYSDYYKHSINAYALTYDGPVENCVFAATISLEGYDVDDKDFSSKQHEQGNTNYYDSYATAKQNANSLDSSYWHFPPTNEYNDGNPMLSSFMSWYSVSVYPNNSSYGSTSRSSISLPVGGNYSPSISSNNLSVYGNVVTANAKTGYEFIGWSVNLGNRSIVANFDIKKYWVNINVYNPNNVEDYVTAKMTMVYTFGGQTVTHTNMVNEAYSSSDPKTTIGSTISISNIQIIMDNPERYYVAEIRDGTGTTYNTTSMTYTVTSSDWQEINIYIRLKQYNVVFE